MPVKRALAVAAACLVAAAIALAVTVAATSAATSAQDPPPGDSNLDALKSWDTDNLSRRVYSSGGGLESVGARNYRIPYHNYSGRNYRPLAPAKACVGYNVRISAGTVRTVHLRTQDATSGQCPSGYSLVTQVCAYASYNTHANSGGFSTEPILPYRSASYRPANSQGTCDRLSYTGADCYSTSYGGYSEWVCSPVARSLSGSLVSVSHAEVCLNQYGQVSLRRSSSDCTAAYAHRVPLHPGCQSAVADAFFQTGGATGAVNDFPVAKYGSESEVGTVTATGNRDSGCVEFAKQQDRLQASVAATGHYLALEGGELVLKANSGTDILDTRITAVRSAGVYGRWDQKGTGYEFAQRQNTSNRITGWVYPVVPADGYRGRVDTRSVLRMGGGLSSVLVHPWNEATGLGAGQGSWACSGGTVARCVRRTLIMFNGIASWAGGDHSLGSDTLFRVSQAPAAGAVWGYRSVHLSPPQDSGGQWCMQGWHPRGQDGAYAIGNSTGRTLSSINTETRLKAADAHWCRSDVRYTLKFTAQQHNTCGSNGRSACAGPPGVALPAVGSEFSSYGRKNCYKTMTGYDEGTAECEHVFPLPECDPDPDNNSRADWREFTAAEVDNIGVAGEPLLVKEGAYCGTNINPPDLAGFDADACVAVDVAVFENRPSGSNAEPGVDAADRTAAVSSSVAVYDLDISAPFPDTASPPKQDDPDLGPIDPSGCADGEEERTSHGTRANVSDATLPPASDQRKSTSATADPASPNVSPYPLPSSSSSSNTAAPPSDYDADNSYAGVRANIAHRYASAIAENTCAAKKEEAELVLAVLKARDASFLRWLDDYKTAADSNKVKFTDYTAVSAGYTGLSAYWAADIAAERTRAAGALKTAYGSLSDALVAAKTAYSASVASASVVAAASSSGCVAHYDAEIARLKKLFRDAEDVALKGGASGIQEEENEVKNNAPKTWNRPVVETADSSIRYTAGRRTHAISDDGGKEESYDCVGDGADRTCKTRTVTTYTCSGYSYTRSGTSSGSYSRKSRSVNDNGILVTTVTEPAITDSSPFSAAYSAPKNEYKSTDPASARTCSDQSISGTTQTQNENSITGDEGTVTAWPEIDTPAKSTSVYTDAATPAFMLEPSLLLGRYHPEHADRTGLKDPNQLTRANAAIALRTLSADNSQAARTPADYASSAVPETQNIPTAAADTLRSVVETAAVDYRKAYTDAYNRAYNRARADMGGAGSQQQAVWRNFHWEYDQDSLVWGGYTQNTTADTRVDAETVIRGQAGCGLFSVAKDGTVSVSATRLDFETSSFGTGNSFAPRAADQRECKVKRTRTPRLTLRYEPPVTASARPWRACPSTITAATRPCGTDSHADKRGDYYNTDFTPAVAGAEKFKLYPTREATEPGEAEIISVRLALADSPPVLCHTVLPSAILISNKAAAGANAVANSVSGWRAATASETSVYRPSGWQGRATTDHCFAKPSSGSGWAVFDDTAHSPMAGASLAYSSGISGIIGSTALTNSSPVAYQGNRFRKLGQIACNGGRLVLSASQREIAQRQRPGGGLCCQISQASR